MNPEPPSKFEQQGKGKNSEDGARGPLKEIAQRGGAHQCAVTYPTLAFIDLFITWAGMLRLTACQLSSYKRNKSRTGMLVPSVECVRGMMCCLSLGAEGQAKRGKLLTGRQWWGTGKQPVLQATGDRLFLPLSAQKPCTETRAELALSLSFPLVRLGSTHGQKTTRNTALQSAGVHRALCSTYGLPNEAPNGGWVME